MRVLTKSRFKLALGCPNKLYYTRKREYANTKKDDPFLMALADGGFQVEELARMQYPGGVLVDDDKYEKYDYQALWEETQELLPQENIIIYEAAFLIDGLFIRTDILVKKGNYIKLIEVKSKTFDPSDEYLLIGKRKGIKAPWKPYLMDVAFQQHVMSLCYPEWSIDSYLMLADKTKMATINGLNQNFRISKKEGGRTGVVKLKDDINQLGDPVLGLKNISRIISDIQEGEKYFALGTINFHELLELAKTHYLSDTYANYETSYRACKHCEFKATKDQVSKGLKSGYIECFTKKKGWGSEQFNRPNTFDIWDFKCGDNLFRQGLIFKEQLSPEDIKHKESEDVITRTDRQWIQIQKDINKDPSAHILIDQLKEQMDTWTYPLNFIDFETNTVALPFHAGRKPYEAIAFQYSHHIYHEDGTIEHASEYINDRAGEFPNFDFVRHLMTDLSVNEGSIFRYSPHENSILNAIYFQLLASDESDKSELMDFIQHITHSRSKSAIKWVGERDMIDQWDILKKYYYNPMTNGSNSLKHVLPAILNSDKDIQTKYARPLSQINITSKNFSPDHVWLTSDGDGIINPYKMLPPVFANWSEEQVEETLSEMDLIGDGGAAMIAYSKMQYMDMSAAERQELRTSLLRYCELDTLAMVILHEHFMNITS